MMAEQKDIGLTSLIGWGLGLSPCSRSTESKLLG